ncbi:protein phosphatase 2C domain-containing protein [Candidatus Woesearchaeota archaeon]|nr:protein phosphatase 2C domain-containing protein [Candidatus Woesearchaeota archaeon]
MTNRMQRNGTQYAYLLRNYALYVGAHTIKGSMRGYNNDIIVADRNVFAVADGAGTQEERGIPSVIVGREIRRDGTMHWGATPAFPLEGIIRSSHKKIQRWKKEEGTYGGTTASVVRIYENGRVNAELAHVGDSRIYKGNVRTEAPLIQLTEDQNEVKKLLEAGVAWNSLDVQQARKRPKLVGLDGDITVAGREYPVEEGDFFLLCTDGLTKALSNDILSSEVYELWRGRKEITVARKLRAYPIRLTSM